MNVKILAILIIDNPTCSITVEVGGPDDKFGHIEREETLAIETARIALRQHKGLANAPVCINMTEIRTRIETVISTGTQHEPT